MKLDILYVSWLKISTRPEQIYKLSKKLKYKTDWFYFKEGYGKSWNAIPKFFSLIWKLIKTRPKIIHVFNGPDVIIYPILFSKLFGTKIILDYRATPLNDFKINHRYNLFIYFLKLTKWIAEKSSNKIVTPIKYFSEKYGYDLLPQIVDYDKSKIIVPNYKKRKNEKILFFSGTLSEGEGILDLLENFIKFKDENYKLWIFGDGPLKQKVLDFAKKDNRIKYYGWKSKNELFGYLQLADLCLYVHKFIFPATIATHTSIIKLGEYLYFKKAILCPDFNNLKYLLNYNVIFYDHLNLNLMFEFLDKLNIIVTKCPKDISINYFKKNYFFIIQGLISD